MTAFTSDHHGLPRKGASGNMRERRRSGALIPMATNDTDPQRMPHADDASRTEPGAPPDAAASDVAASLLADLAKAPLPTEAVAETEGHVAASYAVAPHRPPRANDKTVENPAVFVNATFPMPPPPSSGRQKLGPPAPSVVSMNGAPTVVDGARLFETDPRERAKNQTRVVLASIAGVVVAALIAITILAISNPRAPAKTTAASSTTSSSPPVSPPTSATSTASPVATEAIPATASAASTARPTSPLGNKLRPRASSQSPSSSGTFAAPDRSF